MAEGYILPDDFLSDSSESVASHHRRSDSLDGDSYYTSSSDNDSYGSEDYLDLGSEVSVRQVQAQAGDVEDVSIPFMTLLAEIRLHIYRCALIRSAPILPVELSGSRRVKIWTSDLVPEPARWERRRQPALLRTSRQIRAEALPIYYNVNVFYTAGTVVLAGCIYPMLRYPTPASAQPLRSIRHLHMVVTVVERYEDEESDLPTRVKIALALEVSLNRSRSDLRVKVVEARGERMRGHSVLKSRLNTSAVEDAHQEYVSAAIRSHLGTADKGSYDGFNLLRAAAMMPSILKSTSPELEWRQIMQSRIKVSELLQRGEIIAVHPPSTSI